MTNPETPNKGRRGCFFYGCLTGTVCLVAILLAILLGAYQLKHMLRQFTDRRPMALPTVQLAPDQVAQVQHRVEDFRDSVSAGRPTAPLALTAEDINALIDSDPNFRPVKGKLYVMIEGSQLKALVSLPMEEVGLPRLKGFYLNGTGRVEVAFYNGILRVNLEEFTSKGKALPGVYMRVIQHQNLAQRLNDDPRASIALNHLQSIQVKDGKLILVPKEEH